MSVGAQPAEISTVVASPLQLHSSATPIHSPSTNVFHSAVVGQINLPSVSSQVGHATAVVTSGHAAPCASQPNTNPFYTKFMQGNIRICQGCRNTLRLLDGSIPAPPFDLVIARAERRSFRDKSGTLITPRQEQTCHYHLRLDCVSCGTKFYSSSP